jgi:hypothetical protein
VTLVDPHQPSDNNQISRSMGLKDMAMEQRLGVFVVAPARRPYPPRWRSRQAELGVPKLERLIGGALREVAPNRPAAQGASKSIVNTTRILLSDNAPQAQPKSQPWELQHGGEAKTKALAALATAARSNPMVAGPTKTGCPRIGMQTQGPSQHEAGFENNILLQRTSSSGKYT